MSQTTLDPAKATHPASSHASDPDANGAEAALILSAGIGSFALGLITLVSSPSAQLKALLSFYKPAGQLSGQSTLAIVIWLASWLLLHILWQRRQLPLRRISWIALLLFAASVLLTFPPLAELL